MARDGEANCAYCNNQRYLLDSAGHLIPCPKCGVAHRWKAQALEAFSSRGGVALKQNFENFLTQYDDIRLAKKLLSCKQHAQDFASHPEGQWLTICGERGCGKSHLCAAVTNDLIARSVPALFITMPDLLGSLKQALDLQTNTEQESYSGRLNIFKTAPVLILDDLGAENSSTWSEGVMFEVFDHRYRNRLSTMFASNVHPDKFDLRVASRMQDKEFCTVIENSAPDYRKRAPSERK